MVTRNEAAALFEKMENELEEKGLTLMYDDMETLGFMQSMAVTMIHDNDLAAKVAAFCDDAADDLMAKLSSGAGSDDGSDLPAESD